MKMEMHGIQSCPQIIFNSIAILLYIVSYILKYKNIILVQITYWRSYQEVSNWFIIRFGFNYFFFLFVRYFNNSGSFFQFREPFSDSMFFLIFRLSSFRNFLNKVEQLWIYNFHSLVDDI